MQLHKVFKDWLHRRHITDKVIEDFGICFSFNEIFNDECITIPVKNINGEFLFNKYRRNPLDQNKPKYIYDKGGKVSLYGIDQAKDSKTILITEGEMDCLVAWSHNIAAVSSTGGAVSFQQDWAEYFKDKEVIVCFDNDQAGGEGMVKVLNIIPYAKMLFIPDRAGVKDISDYVEGGGNLNELIKTAKFLPTLEAVKEDRSNRYSLYQSVHFHDAYIKEHEKHLQREARVHKKQLSNDRILRAKEYPIDNLLKFIQGKTKCLWHNEKTSSLHYYEDTNTVYCFGCGKYGDAIDIYRELHNCSFNEAVKNLQ